eukprot:1072735-Pyramimonas_sp.AAC.1
MREQPLAPSVELPMRPRSAVMDGGDACESSHWRRRWRSLWGHEAPVSYTHLTLPTILLV